MWVEVSKGRVRVACWAVVLVVAAASAQAEQWYFAGSRAQAMGGAGVAVIDDSLASYWNPAALTRKKGWDVQIPATLGGSIERKALQDLGRVLVDVSAIEDDLNALLDGESFSPAEIRRLIEAVDELPTLGLAGQSFQGGLQVGLLGRYNRFSFGVLSNSVGNVHPTFNGISLSDAPDVPTRIADVIGLGPFQTPSPAAQELATSIAGMSEWTEPQANHLLWLGEGAGFDFTDPTTRETVKEIALATADPDVESATGANVRGLSTQEFGIGYAIPIPMPFFEPLDEKISVGAQMKYMLGVSFRKRIDYESGIDASDVFDDLFTLDNVETSHNFGLDLGVLYEPFEWLRWGVTARNVNGPNFDAVNGPDLELSPQVRMGVAVMPVEIWTIAFDVDLTENDAIGLPGFRSRLVSIGTEVRIPLGSKVDLALRGGGYTNASEGFNNDWGITAGLGARFFGFHLDVGGGLSPNFEEFATSADDATDLPTRIQLGVNLKWEHRF